MAARRARVYAPPRRRAVAAPRRAQKPAPRRQYVKLRTRQRKEISRRMSGVFKRAMILLVVTAVGALGVWHSQEWIQRQLNRHTPELALKAPPELADLPIFSVLPERRWLLWLPGVPTGAEHRIEREFSGVRRARIENHFFDNRVEIYLEPRQPLVQCGGRYMDGEGVLFPLRTTNVVPTMVLAHAQPSANFGSWLLALSRIPWLWRDVTELKENSQGDWTLTLRSGPVLLWGFPDDTVPSKAEALQKIIARAASDHGGALRADLRFFREGRIIVGVRRPLHA